MATILVSIIIIGCCMVSFVGNSTLTQHNCVQRNIQVDLQWHQESLNLQSPMERWIEPPLHCPPNFFKKLLLLLLLLCVPKIQLLGSQSICIVGFGFPTMGDPMLENLSILLFPPTLLFTSVTTSLSLNDCSFLSLFSPELPTPSSSLHSLIYSLR